MSLFFPAFPQQTPRGGAVPALGSSLLIHGLLLGAALWLLSGRVEPLLEMARPIAVSLIEQIPLQPQKPLPPPPKAAAPQAKPVIMPVLAAASTAPTASEMVVAPAPPVPLPPIVASPVAAPVAEALHEARFDADYLANPKPPYPNASRKLNETGTAYLRVQVGADGSALKVELKTSSGYPRLDQSALDTVAQWRFVPARRGSTPVQSWVVVPIVFSLN
ncbi:MAG: hypothetical protein RIR00_150 [Pseudomonadota bacterium]|jgi:protein TonB